MTPPIHPKRFRLEVDCWAQRTKTTPREVRLQQMTRKWASCSRFGRLTFSQELLCAPKKFRDFVIVHELLHLRVPNHGRLFQNLLKLYLGSAVAIDWSAGKVPTRTSSASIPVP